MAQCWAQNQAAGQRSRDSEATPDVGFPVPLNYPALTEPRYLLTYDAVAFHAYLETIVASNTYGTSRTTSQYQSLWLLTDAANVMFREAKRRCYIVSSTSKKPLGKSADLADDEAGWEALDEIEGIVGGKVGGSKDNAPSNPKSWPKGIEPTLEELPKWGQLTAVLTEIEEEIRRQESQGGWDSTYLSCPLFPKLMEVP
jgi:DNA excision repair protein ERCC-4